MKIKKALLWSAFWIGMAALFNIGIYLWGGKELALQFLGGYIIEQSLSLDNLFLFLLIFRAFGIQTKNQRRVLNYGIAGAILLRLCFIMLGVSVVESFHWVLYLFGLLLIFSGTKIFVSPENEQKDFNQISSVRWLEKWIPMTKRLEGEKFFIRKEGKLFATPLFVVLIVVEISDLIFAIDSIPAIFSITTDPFIVYTSNIFALLGLRNFYFVLERLHDRFQYLRYGVGLILIFTGIKLSLLYFGIEMEILLSVGVIAGIVILSIVGSILPVKASNHAWISKKHPYQKAQKK